MIKKLATFIKGFQLEEVPVEIQLKAKYLLLDSIGVIQQSDLSKLQTAGFENNDLTNTFIAATKLVEKELDEGNSIAKGHPACHFVSALLQIAKNEHCSTDQLLTAFITGYEVGARIGEITSLKKDIHPHANWGMVGGAAALGKLLNWEHEQIRQGINIAAQLSYPTLWKSVLEGHEVRNVLIGMNNLTLLLLPNLIQSGYSATDDTLELLFTKVLGIEFKKEEINLDPSTSYLEHTYFKFYDSCRFCHGPIDALKKALKQGDIRSVEQIQHITIATYESAAMLNNKHVANSFAGKFSIPYSVAKEAFRYTGEPIDEEKILALAQRIDVRKDEEIIRQLPTIRATRLTLHSDSKRTTIYLESAHGDGDTENLYDHVEQKFFKNVEHIFTAQQAKEKVNQLLYSQQFPYELLN